MGEEANKEVFTSKEMEQLAVPPAKPERRTYPRVNPPAEMVQPFNFRHPSFLASHELRQLKIHHEEIVHELAARLSIYLRVEFGLQLSKLHALTYKEFVESIDGPAHLTLFKLEPLRGVCLMNLSPRLGLAIVDRLLGGPGSPPAENRDLTEIEVALLDQSEQIVLEEWSHHWSRFMAFKPQILGHENTAHFLQTSSPETIMVIVEFEARMGECDSPITLIFPYPTLEPVIRQIAQKFDVSESQPAPKPPAPTRWNPDLANIKLPIVAEWPKIPATLGQIANLKPGDVLPLDSELIAQVEVRVGKVSKYQGRLGVFGTKRAVEITKVQTS